MGEGGNSFPLLFMVLMRYLLIALLLSSCSTLPLKEQGTPVLMLRGLFGGGTGFVIRSPYTGKRYIMTNAHVCDVASIVSPTEELPYMLKPLKIADNTDLCLAEVGYAQGTLELSKEAPQAFDRIHILGYGLLLPLTLTEGTYVGTILGQVLAVTNPGYGTAPILPGNSGSPVLNDKGEVIGVVYASGGSIDNRVIMVPMSDIYRFMEGY
jgi:S1-C subfamily serine protease